MISLCLASLVLSLLILIFLLKIPQLRRLAKWGAVASALSLAVSLMVSLSNWGKNTAEKIAAQRQAAELKAAETEKAKIAEAERKRQEEEAKAAAEARRAELLRPPSEQVRFIQVVEHARAQYKAGHNDLQKGAARLARAQIICSILKSSRIEGWIANIDRLSTIETGDAVLIIKIAEKITLGTLNSSAVDKLYGTLIKSKHSLYQDLLMMKGGAAVRIYGQLFPREADCYWEMNSTLAKSLEEPAWVMRFSRVQPVDLSGF